MKTLCVSGSNEPPGQLVANDCISIASGPSILLTTGGVKIGPILYFDTSFTASARSSGGKLSKLSIEMPWMSYAGGLVTNGCVGAYHSPGTSPFGTGRSSIGHTGFAVPRSNTYRQTSVLG